MGSPHRSIGSARGLRVSAGGLRLSDKVSPLVVWLGSDEAKEVTGRTFLATGNTVQLLSWQSQLICQKDNTEGPFEVAEIGEAVRDNFEHWPKGIQPTPRPFV